MGIEIKKSFNYTVSIQKGTNKLIGCSKADWLGVKEGHYVIIGSDQDYYKVLDREQFFYIKDAKVVDSDTLEVEENTNVRVLINDILVFTHKEYEIKNVLNVENVGAGYEKGDVLKPEGGIPRYNSFDELDIPAQFKVEDIDESGGIKSLLIENKGVYAKAPENSTALLGGNGSGAVLELEIDLLEDRSIEERTVSGVTFVDENTTRIHLDHPLPPRVLEGKISINKWLMTLHMNYAKETKINVGYKIAKDFSPHNSIPFITRDLKDANPVLYNQGVKIIDEKLHDQEERIKELEAAVEDLTARSPAGS